MMHSELYAALEWYIDMGIDECTDEYACNRLLLPLELQLPKQMTCKAISSAKYVGNDRHHDSQFVHPAFSCNTLEELKICIEQHASKHLLRLGARNMVFADGLVSSKVMVIGEAPGRDEDIQGIPFVGKSGKLLDAMFNAIGLSRSDHQVEKSLYITNILPWKPPDNRAPSTDEVAFFLPFVRQHIYLVKPQIILLMGGTASQHLLGIKGGITKIRGKWYDYKDRDYKAFAMPSLHPAYLLRTTDMKRYSWIDLQRIQRKILELTSPSGA